MLSSSSHLTARPADRRACYVATGIRNNGARIAANVLFGGVLIAGALLVHVAGAHTTRACPCRYPGGMAPPGEVICLNVDGKRLLARCEMLLNNSSWRILDESCPTASLTKPAGPMG